MMGKACVLCEWFLLNPKKYKKKEKTQEKTQEVGIVTTLEIHLLSFIFLNFSLGSIQVLDGFYFSIIVK
jgi:hypothetical protein